MRRLIPFCILSYLFISCSDARKNDKMELEETRVSQRSAKESLPASALSGKELSKVHCSSCHAYVNPESLPKAAWRDDVLPAMGHRLGIYTDGLRPDSLFELGIS